MGSSWVSPKRSKTSPKSSAKTIENGSENNRKRGRNDRNGAENIENCAETKHLNSTNTARRPRAWQFEANSNAKEIPNNQKVQLTAGNTARGIYKTDDQVDVFVDLTRTFDFLTNDAA